MNNLTTWERMELIHNKNRPTVNDYIPALFTRFMEFHGDRMCGDDGAIIGGIGFLSDTPVTVLAQVKGRTLDENKKSNFAMPHPEGYRKALRLAKQAEKFHRPIVCLVDTPGAFCGVEAEKRCQGEAIARNLYEFMTLKTPIVTVILGEGGSGGALALAVCDELAMLQNAIYSVISPRSAASILWKDPTKEKEAAEILKITAEDLMRFGVCDKIIPEPEGGAHLQPNVTADSIYEYIVDAVSRLKTVDLKQLLDNRYQKFRKIGMFTE